MAVFVAAIALMMLLPACDTTVRRDQFAPAPAGTLRIISSLPLRGVDGAQARQIDQAIDLAITQRSAKAGAWRVEHVSLDDGDPESGDWSAATERDNARRATNDPAVIAYIGPYNSGAVGIALPITNRAHLLVISPSATWPGLTESGWNAGEPGTYYPVAPRNFVRLTAPDDAQGSAAAQVAFQDGAKSLVAVEDGSSYSEGLASAFISRAQSLGLSAAGPFAISPSNPLSTDLNWTQHDAVFYAPSSASNAATVARALASAHPNMKVYASDTALGDQVADSAGSALSSWRVIFNGGNELPDSARAKSFSEAFTKTYGSTPGRFAANGYDAANLVLDAVAGGAGSDRLKVLQKVVVTSGYEGAGGTVTVDGNGDNKFREMDLYGWQGGKFALSKTITLSP